MNEPVVATDKLSKRYGERVAVDDVSLTVRRGEVYGFLGPNGAGKTTTLRMLLGLVRPTRGTAKVLGGSPADSGVLRRIGALVEDPGLYPYLCGRDNLRVLARYKRLGDADVDQALEQVGLSDRGGDKVKSYSLGMKQRLGVAAALLGEPELLILDEPTNGLDPAGMADMRELVRRLAASGQTVLLSSHLLGEVQQICDRVGVISDGRLLTESTVAELRGASSLLVRAEPIAQAVRAVEAAFGDVEVRQSPSGEPRAELHVDVDAERAPDVARALVAAGVNVYEIRMSERTLEQVFFEMTSSNEPAAVAASGKESR